MAFQKIAAVAVLLVAVSAASAENVERTTLIQQSDWTVTEVRGDENPQWDTRFSETTSGGNLTFNLYGYAGYFPEVVA